MKDYKDPSNNSAQTPSYANGSVTDDWGEDATIVRPGVADKALELSAGPTTKAAFLVFISGIELGRNIPLNKETLVVGRGSECDLVLQDESVSRVHATLYTQPDGSVVVEDHGSTNGTFINDVPVSRAMLNDGDRLVFGKASVFRYSLLDQVEQNYQKQLHSSYVRDPLTSVYNKRFLMENLENCLSYAARHDTPLSLLIFDLDFFKDVNDIHGHQTGDKVLVELSAIAQTIIRGDDMLARYGGEEFAVIAPVTNSEGINKLAERLRESIASHKYVSDTIEGMTFSVTVSVGCVTLPPQGDATAEQLIAEADRNLYLAKQGGRDRVVFSILN